MRPWNGLSFAEIWCGNDSSIYYSVSKSPIFTVPKSVIDQLPNVYIHIAFNMMTKNMMQHWVIVVMISVVIQTLGKSLPKAQQTRGKSSCTKVTAFKCNQNLASESLPNSASKPWPKFSLKILTNTCFEIVTNIQLQNFTKLQTPKPDKNYISKYWPNCSFKTSTKSQPKWDDQKIYFKIITKL